MYFRIYNVDQEPITKAPFPLAKQDDKGQWFVYISNLEDFLYTVREADCELVVNHVAGEFTIGVY